MKGTTLPCTQPEPMQKRTVGADGSLIAALGVLALAVVAHIVFWAGQVVVGGASLQQRFGGKVAHTQRALLRDAGKPCACPAACCAALPAG